MSWSVGFGVLVPVCDEPNVAVTGDSRVSRVQHAMLNMHANMLMHAKRDNTKHFGPRITGSVTLACVIM